MYRVSRDMVGSFMETLTLARATYTHVWARNAEGGRGGKTEHKRHIHGNDVIPLREV